MKEIYKGYEIRVFKKEYKEYYEVCKCCKHQGWITKKLEKPLYVANISTQGFIYSTGENKTKEEAINKAKEYIKNNC